MIEGPRRATLDFYFRDLVLRGTASELQRVRDGAQSAQAGRSLYLMAWGQQLQRLLSYPRGTGPMSKEQALCIGQELLRSGESPHDTSTVAVTAETAQTWEVARVVRPPYSLALAPFADKLFISKKTGKFRFEMAF